MYFPVVEPATSRLLALRMVPMRIGKMRLGRASPAEAEWLRGRLSGVCGPFWSHVEKVADGSLALRWRSHEPPG